jgi:hypothetical protein
MADSEGGGLVTSAWGDSGQRRRYRRRTLADRHRPRVLEVAPGLVHESGPILPPDWSPDRVAVLAHWSNDSEPTRSVVKLLRELDEGGYRTVLVSAAQALGPIGRTCTWAPGGLTLPEATTVLRRANVGYDFGSWAAVLAAFPGVRRAPRVLLVNDSLIGPFSSLEPVLAAFEGSPTPVWGLSGSLQHRPHVQSFFMGYRDAVLDSAPLRKFWGDIRVESRKAKIVRYCELGLSEALDEAGLGWGTMFEPVMHGNRSLLEAAGMRDSGFPFWKASLVEAADVGMASWVPAGFRAEAAPPRWQFALDVDGLWGVVKRNLRSQRPGSSVFGGNA